MLHSHREKDTLCNGLLQTDWPRTFFALIPRGHAVNYQTKLQMVYAPNHTCATVAKKMWLNLHCFFNVSICNLQNLSAFWNGQNMWIQNIIGKVNVKIEPVFESYWSEILWYNGWSKTQLSLEEGERIKFTSYSQRVPFFLSIFRSWRSIR